MAKKKSFDAKDYLLDDIQRVRKAMRSKNINQKTLAAMCGKTEQQISKCFNKLKRFPPETRAAIFTVLGLDMNVEKPKGKNAQMVDELRAECPLDGFIQYNGEIKKLDSVVDLVHYYEEAQNMALPSSDEELDGNRKALMTDIIREDYVKALEFARDADVEGLRRFFKEDSNMPLLIICHGSKASGLYAKLLYGMYNCFGCAITPYSVNGMSDEALRNSKILVISSGGHDMDMQFVIERLAKVNPDHTACITHRFNRADKPNYVYQTMMTANPQNCFAFEHKLNRDGFIAIASIFVNLCVLYKAFTNKIDFATLNLEEAQTKNGERKLKVKDLIPKNYYEFYTNYGTTQYKQPKLGNMRHLVVLHGAYGEVVAHDLESKLVEGGACSVQISDYRNFCHGRFVFVSNHIENNNNPWIQSDTVVVFLVTPREYQIFKNVREFLPSQTPIAIIQSEYDSPLATIDMLLKANVFAAQLGKEKGINLNSPLNYGEIDKRIPRTSAKFDKDFSSYGCLRASWNGSVPNSVTLDEKDSKKPLLFPKLDRTKNTFVSVFQSDELDAAIAQSPNIIKNEDKYKRVYDSKEIPLDDYKPMVSLNSEDLKPITYDCTTMKTWSFIHGDDEREDEGEIIDISLGNMCSGFPFTIDGIEFKTSEHAYIMGMFGDGSEKHINIQKQIIDKDKIDKDGKSTNQYDGFSIKKKLRRKYENFKNPQWNDFNVQWMLYVVWMKCLHNKDFRKLLVMDTPRNAMIMENSTNMNGETAAFWGAKNKELFEARKKIALYKMYEDPSYGKKLAFTYSLGFNYIGKFEGVNCMGRILKQCQISLIEGTEPPIDFDLLRQHHIHLLDKELTFDNEEQRPTQFLKADDEFGVKPKKRGRPKKILPLGSGENAPTTPGIPSDILSMPTSNTKVKTVKDKKEKVKYPTKGLMPAIIGDIIGIPYERSKNATKDFNFPFKKNKMHFSDDTILTLAVAEWLMGEDRTANALKPIVLKYAKQYKDEKFWGRNFKEWVAAEGNIDRIGITSNGAAMRVAPIAWAAKSLDEALNLAEIQARLTHNSDEAARGAKSVVASSYMALHGKSKEEIKNYISETFGYNLNQTIDNIRKDYKFEIECDKCVPESLVCWLESKSFEEAIRNVISLGGDADTMAAIVGAICGATPKMYATQSLSKMCYEYLTQEQKELIDKFNDMYVENPYEEGAEINSKLLKPKERKENETQKKIKRAFVNVEKKPHVEGEPYTMLGIGDVNFDVITVREYPDHIMNNRKILSEEIVLQEIGGNFGNVAANLAAFGWKSYPIIKTDNTNCGVQIEKDLQRYGVDTRYVTHNDGDDVSVHLSYHWKDENDKWNIGFGGAYWCDGRKADQRLNGFPSRNYLSTKEDAHKELFANLDFIPSVFFMGISDANKRASSIYLAKELRLLGTTIYFEINSWKNAPNDIKSIENSDVIKFSRECVKKAANKMFEKDNTTTHDTLLDEITSNAQGKLFIETLDKDGAQFKLNGGEWIVIPPIVNNNVVDTEGAGDMTTASFIAALGKRNCLKVTEMTEDFVKDALTEAMTIASKSVSYMGSKGMFYADGTIPSTDFSDDILHIEEKRQPKKRKVSSRIQKRHWKLEDIPQKDYSEYKKEEVIAYRSDREMWLGEVRDIYNSLNPNPMSNFYKAELNYNGITFKSSEAMYHYYVFMEHPEVQEGILNCKGGADVAIYTKGTKVEKDCDHNRTRWRYMALAIETKYLQNEIFRNKLIATDNYPLVEWQDSDVHGAVVDGMSDFVGGEFNGHSLEGFFVGMNGCGKVMMAVRDKFKGWTEEQLAEYNNNRSLDLDEWWFDNPIYDARLGIMSELDNVVRYNVGLPHKMLFIHGSSCSGQGKDLTRLSAAFKDYEILAPDCPVDVFETLGMLRDILRREKIDIIIGHSMGGFYAQQLHGHLRLCINAASILSDDEDCTVGSHKYVTPRVSGAKSYYITEDVYQRLIEMEQHQYDGVTEEDKKLCYGIFGTNDDSSHAKEWHDMFAEHYPNTTMLFDGKHSLTDKDIRDVVKPLLEKLMNE